MTTMMTAFSGRPKDGIERFGRHFFPTIHTHLHDGNEREILPWLKLSAEMDPTQIETYVTASYWLRTTLGTSQRRRGRVFAQKALLRQSGQLLRDSAGIGPCLFLQ